MQGQSPCPPAAAGGTLLCLFERRRGSRGNPRRGFPLIFWALCVCAVTLGGCRWLVLPSIPISLVLAQRNGVEPPKKGAFLPWRLHHPRERCRSGGWDVPRPTWAGVAPYFEASSKTSAAMRSVASGTASLSMFRLISSSCPGCWRSSADEAEQRICGELLL